MKYEILLSVISVIQQSEAVEEYLDRLTPVVKSLTETHEIILVCNGFNASDVIKIKDVIKKHTKIRLLFLNDRYTMDIAVMSGIENSIGDYCIIMEHETDPVELISVMLEKAINGTDIVIASSGYLRYSFFKRLLAKLYYRVIQFMLEAKQEIDPSYYTCFSRKVLTIFEKTKNTIRNYRFLRTSLGFSCEKINYVPHQKTTRPHSLPPRASLNMRIEAFFSYSYLPLRYASTLAFLIGTMSFCYLIFIFLSLIFNHHVISGWASTSVLYGVMFGSLFFLLGTIGWYLNILLRETKQLPLFQISDEFSSGSSFCDWEKENVIDQ